MITNQTKLQIVDNSSASVVRVFKLPKNTKKASVGDIVKASVISRKASKLKVNLRKGEIVDVLIIETKSPERSLWGSKKTSSNKAVVVKIGLKPHDYTLLSSRIKSKISFKVSLREGLAKILVLSQGLF
jgi:ribosomal protein L14